MPLRLRLRLYLQQCLREVFGNHPLVGDIQGTGFVAALQFVEDKATRKRFDNENDIAWRCRTLGFEEGVIIRSTLGRMIMAPALVVPAGAERSIVRSSAIWVRPLGGCCSSRASTGVT